MRLDRNPVRAFMAALVVACSLASSAVAQTGSGEPARSLAHVSASPIRIENFGRIDPAYYRGAQPEGHDYADLAALGIKTVINLTSDDEQDTERALVERAGMTYVQIPMTTRKSPSGSQIAEFLALVSEPASQPVYVHCVGGRHRTGVMTAVYRMTRDGWTADRAFAEMKKYDFGPDFLHPELKKFVYGYRPGDAPAAPATVASRTAG